MKHPLIASLFLSLTSLGLPALAQTPPVVEVMEQAVETAPSVLAAKADIGRANAAASRLRTGPYEFEVNASGGQRTIDDPLVSEQRYTEWSAGVSRTIRLPSKQRIDRDLARLETSLADARLADALYQERLRFAELWSDWVRAELLTETSSELAAEAERLADLEQLSVDKGAGRQIRADQLAAEASLVRLQAEQDKLTAQGKRATLEARYPDIELPAHPLLLDLPPDAIARILEAPANPSPSSRAARLVSEQARLRARRARSDQTPDPTFGLDFGNEFGGNETSLMARVTIPIGGSVRRAAKREYEATATVAELDAIGLERQLYQTLETTRQSARMSRALHEDAASALESSSLVFEKIRKGYAMGEITVSELISSHRALLSTQRTAAEQRAAMEAAFLKLMVLKGDIVPATSPDAQE